MNKQYDHYIAVDWSITNMAIARMTAKSNKITAFEAPSDVGELRKYLENLRGAKIVTIEESTASQWLYTELKNYADKILICDPYRNRLLSEGAKTDKIDATKMVQLLKTGLMKEVYHTADKFLYLRKLVSGYEDLVYAGVRLKNQRSALLRACGHGKMRRGIEVPLTNPGEKYVLDCLDRQIKAYEDEKKGYEKEFKKLAREHPEIRHQKSLPGIDNINAVKIVARVVSPHRFADKGHYLSYAGLIKLDRISGGRHYGKKNPRYCRQLKSVYKTGVLSALGGNNNPIRNYYDYLIQEKAYPDYQARHKACRRLATLSWGIFKSGKKYQLFGRTNTHVENSQEA